MDKYNFEDYMDFGCPICGAEASKDCLDDCEGVEAPPQVWGFVEEQLAYVTHKVSRRLMKEFRMKMFTDKLENIVTELKDYRRFASALVNSKILDSAEEVLDFFTMPTSYRRHYVIWSELAKPTDENSETWKMFMEAIRNTDGEQT